jgi:nucleoid DNA-binding protein
MNKKQIIDDISELLPKGSDSQLIVDRMFDTIRESLKKGEKVVISGFGTFRVVEHLPALRRNPKTNQKVMVGPLKKLRFRPSKIFFK